MFIGLKNRDKGNGNNGDNGNSDTDFSTTSRYQPSSFQPSTDLPPTSWQTSVMSQLPSWRPEPSGFQPFGFESRNPFNYEPTNFRPSLWESKFHPSQFQSSGFLNEHRIYLPLAGFTDLSRSNSLFPSHIFRPTVQPYRSLSSISSGHSISEHMEKSCHEGICITEKCDNGECRYAMLKE